MARIDSYVEPRTLFRYRSLRNFDREIELIEEAKLHCAPFNSLNDPMEGLFRSSRKLRESAEFRLVRRSITDDKSAIRICSFSEVKNHELMWAHYADQFRGICVAYNFKKLLSNLPEDVAFVRMFYNETEPLVSRNGDEAARRILSYKNYRWLYEREWRMFTESTLVHYKALQCVDKVYLGARIDEDHKQDLMLRLKTLGIKFRQMTINKYSISFAPSN